MKELDVRKALYASEIKAIQDRDPTSLVVDELSVGHGDCRIDVAVINGHLHGFELKSASDTLERLPVQRDVYGRVFDYVTLVVAEKHVEKARDMLPAWWGIATVVSENGDYQLSRLRLAEQNTQPDALSVAQLLWRDEALAILQARGFDKIKSKPKPYLWNLIANQIPLVELQQLVRSSLKARSNWRVADPLFARCDGLFQR